MLNNSMKRILLFSIFILRVLALEQSTSFRKCQNSFDWHNEIVEANNYNSTLFVNDFREVLAYQNINNYKVLIVGDSLDLHSCVYLQRITNITSTNPNSKLCHSDEHMTITMYRISGIVSKVGVVINNNQMIKIMTAQKPDAIVFSSFAWDILHSYKNYCKTSTYISQTCICSHVRMVNAVCINESNHHYFNRQQHPWCQNDFVRFWKFTYQRIIHNIKETLPQSKIYLRNQPYASTLFMGSPMCVGSLNDIAHQTAIDLLPENEVGTSCRFLNMNALLAPVPHFLGITDRSAPNDGLHYYPAAHAWTNYMLSTIAENAV